MHRLRTKGLRERRAGALSGVPPRCPRSMRPPTATSRPRHGVGAVIVALALCALATTSCVNGTGATSATSSNTLVLYNAQHEQTTSAIVAAFTKRTGITVRVKNDDEDDITAQIEAEGSRSAADVVYTENSNWLQQLDDKGLLAKVDTPTLANVPAVDSAANGNWVGVSARISVLVYNTDGVSPSEVPTSVLDLADPRWKGKIELAPSETDFWPIIDSVARQKGTAAALAWLKGLRTNVGANDNIPDNETLTSDVSKGVTDLALIDSYYFYRLEAEVGAGSVHAKIAYFAPRDPGYVQDVSGAGIVKSSKHQAAAQRFLAFLTSEAGQNVLAHSDSFEYPLHPGVDANAELTPLDQLQPVSFTPAQLGTGLEAHQLLIEAGLA